ncbi:MAG TPA: RHS repeat-associated core domain-containing protein, partial [Thermoanaerobaculia bacterium]|nr:RHS repeat-associated core domain-containing protein [Thermoanaerobaculia bacterium]
GGNYCPTTPVNRAAMAIFLSATFRLGLTFVSTDHLGTPNLAAVVTGRKTWEGGFEPFGADWNGAQAKGVFLRFPGQWVDGGWENAGVASGLAYNVFRWYEAGTGRYTSPDPWRGSKFDPHTFAYVSSKPLVFTDPLGLRQFPFGAGQFCRDPSCRCEPPVKVLVEDSASLLTSTPLGCVDADAVYSASCVTKIPDNFSCTLKCDPSAPTGQQGTLICYPKGFILGPFAHVVLDERPRCLKQIPPGWPPNPLGQGGS